MFERFAKTPARMVRRVAAMLFDRGRASCHPHLRTILSVQGHLSTAESLLLFELASQVLDGCIVEVGSFRGKSTTALALGLRQGCGAPVYAIEPHESFEGAGGGRFGPEDRVAFFRNMVRCGVAETVRLVNLSSEMVIKGWELPVGLLWIDGDHRYSSVRRDFECWQPFVIPGGVIALHDSKDPAGGPGRVVAEAVSSGAFKITQQVDLATVLEKQLHPDVDRQPTT